MRIDVSPYSRFSFARVTLNGKSATLFDMDKKEVVCRLDNYSNPIKTFRILSYGCPNELTYVKFSD